VQKLSATYLNKALKLTSQDELPPRFLFSKEHNIFLSGKIDWIEYLPEDDSMHIIDFIPFDISCFTMVDL
jgi:ATP-dependent helicase/DNAse subunit B